MALGDTLRAQPSSYSLRSGLEQLSTHSWALGTHPQEATPSLQLDHTQKYLEVSINIFSLDGHTLSAKNINDVT